jgi:hypothetical protein
MNEVEVYHWTLETSLIQMHSNRSNERQSESKSTSKHQKNHHGLGPPSAPRFVPKEQTVRPSASRGGHYSIVHHQIPH